MKHIKKLIALAMVAATILAVAVPAMAVTTGVVKYVNVTPNLNFRETPNGKLISRIPYGNSVYEYQYDTINGVNWSHILYDGKYGYVQTQYLTLANPNLPDWAKRYGLGNITTQNYYTYPVLNTIYIQQDLLWLGIDVGPKGADGHYGQGTKAAVEHFQYRNGLTVDGIAGPLTKAKLYEKAGPF